MAAASLENGRVKLRLKTQLTKTPISRVIGKMTKSARNLST